MARIDKNGFMSKVEHLDDERDLGNGYIVSLKSPYCWEEFGCHVRGFDTKAEMYSAAKWMIKICRCEECCNTNEV